MSIYADIPVTVSDPDQWQRDLDLLEGAVTAEELQRREFAPLRFTVPGVIPEGFTVLAGAPKAGKSWLMLSTAIAVAMGGKALGHLQVDRRPVLYLALEDSHRRLQRRIDQLVPGQPWPDTLTMLTDVRRGQIGETMDAYLRLHPSAGLIVLDVLAKVTPPAAMGESTYQRDYRVGEALQRITRDHPNLALVAIHHDRKADSRDFVDAVSGTNGVSGSADTVALLTRERHESTGLLSITGRDIEEVAYALDKNETGGWLLHGGTLEAAAQAATQARVDITASHHGDVMRQVVEQVQAMGKATPREIEERLGIASARVYLTRAVEKGMLAKDGRGTYTPLLQVSQVLLHSESYTSNTSNTGV